MVLLENDEFLLRLKSFFIIAKVKGSVGITMKRYDGRTKHLPKDGSKRPEPVEYMCLLRAKLAKNKIATIVHPKDLNKFQQAYNSLLQSSFDGLKRFKKEKLKTRATQ